MSYFVCQYVGNNGIVSTVITKQDRVSSLVPHGHGVHAFLPQGKEAEMQNWYSKRPAEVQQLRCIDQPSLPKNGFPQRVNVGEILDTRRSSCPQRASTYRRCKRR